MTGMTQAELRRQETMVLAACAEQILRRPLAAVTMKCVAKASDLPEYSAYRALNRVARSRDHLIRRGVMQLIAEVVDRIDTGSAAARSGVFETIHACVADMADLVAAEPHCSLYRLVVREGDFHRWLHDLYEERVAGAFCRRLEQAAREAGESAGVAVCFRPGAARAALRRLEWSLALPTLLPGGAPAADDRAELVRTIAREAFASSYAWNLGQAA